MWSQLHLQDKQFNTRNHKSSNNLNNKIEIEQQSHFRDKYYKLQNMSRVEKWGREQYLQFIQKTEHCTILIQTLVFRRQRTQKGQIAITFKIISLSNNQNK